MIYHITGGGGDSIIYSTIEYKYRLCVPLKHVKHVARANDSILKYKKKKFCNITSNLVVTKVFFLSGKNSFGLGIGGGGGA